MHTHIHTEQSTRTAAPCLKRGKTAAKTYRESSVLLLLGGKRERVSVMWIWIDFEKSQLIVWRRLISPRPHMYRARERGNKKLLISTALYNHTIFSLLCAGLYPLLAYNTVMTENMMDRWEQQQQQQQPTVNIEMCLTSIYSNGTARLAWAPAPV